MNRETRMTITDFLIALEEATPDDWYLDADYQIRRYDETRQRVCCPITALGVEQFANFFHEDAKRLGLTRAHAELIARELPLVHQGVKGVLVVVLARADFAQPRDERVGFEGSFHGRGIVAPTSRPPRAKCFREPRATAPRLTRAPVTA